MRASRRCTSKRRRRRESASRRLLLPVSIMHEESCDVSERAPAGLLLALSWPARCPSIAHTKAAAAHDTLHPSSFRSPLAIKISDNQRTTGDAGVLLLPVLPRQARPSFAAGPTSVWCPPPPNPSHVPHTSSQINPRATKIIISAASHPHTVPYITKHFIAVISCYYC